MWSYIQGANFTLGSSLFGAVKLTKVADSDKYFYSRFVVGFDKNVIVFGADMSFCRYAALKLQKILK